MQALMPLARQAHRDSAFSIFEFNEAIVQRSFVVAIEFGFAKVAERNGEVVGGMVGVVTENHFGVKCGVDLFTCAHGGTDRLIKSFREWAREQGAEFIQITDLSGNERYRNLITGLGLRPSGINFMGAV